MEMLIDIGKIMIMPFEFDSILELKIEKELNEHSTLYAYGVIKGGKEFTPVTDKIKDEKIICKNGGQVYFSGVLQSVKVTRSNDIYYLEIYAASNTILLDITKHRRSFQDNNQNYKSIVENVIGDKSIVKYNADAKTVDNIILQYNETDWEFAKRLASHTNDVLIPITDDIPAFHFGVPGTEVAELKSSSYAISKDIDAFWRMKTEDKPLPIEAAVLYTVETDLFVCELGKEIKLKCIDADGEIEAYLHVCRVSLSLVDSALTVVYTLCAQEAICTPKVYNRAITGVALSGKVLKVENDNVKLHLDIDDKQDEAAAHLFVYATSYSAEGHTGWYVMPEKGDTVQLFFPDEDEKHAYASSSLRQDNTAKTTDPLIKYWRTAFGKEIKMDEKEVLISSVDDKTYIRINMDTGIDIIASRPIKITSEDDIGIDGKNDISIKSGRNIAMNAQGAINLSCSGSSITIDGNISLSGGIIRENG